jgi:hypothetical protein
MRLALLLLVFATSAASAQVGSVRFRILDLDGDGYLSLAEAAGIGDVVERFDRADTDRDGSLSAREFDRLDRIKVRGAATQRHRVRAAVARDVRAAEREAAAETASAEGAASAAAGASGR